MKLQCLGVAAMHLAHRIADHANRLQHATGVPDRDAIGREPLAHDLLHCLGDRQVAGAQQHHQALARVFEHGHLAERRDLVDAGVGSRIGQEYQPFVQAHSHAVSHVVELVRIGIRRS